MKDNWSRSSGFWDKIKTPLRPIAEDLVCIQNCINTLPSEFQELAVLIMGVTPDYQALRWPPATEVRAIDISINMLKHVWPGRRSATLLADWQQMPLATASQDVVLLDAGLCLLPYPEGQVLVARELARCIKPGGLFIVRLFVLPERPESTEAVLQATASGAIPDLNLLRLRLWMALQISPAVGVSSQQFWQTLEHHWPDFKGLAPLLASTVEDLRYFSRSSDARTFHFDSLSAYIQLFEQERFHLEGLYTPTYEAGDRCPTLVFRRLVTTGQ